MPRLSHTVLVLLVLLLAGSGVWWIMDSDSPYPSYQILDSLRDSTSIHWSKEGVAAIDAEGPLDALSALGYVHGMTRGWTVALWRQTAQGALSRWFGTGLLPLDRHTRRLGLAAQAKAAYAGLPATTQRRLRAYSRGLNAALQTDLVQQRDPFLLLDVRPAPWKPWHTLTVERLLAWMASPSLTPPPGAPPGVDRFCEVDDQLRRWLHLHGWSRSVAWAVRPPAPDDSARPVLFQRHVFGATAEPLVQEVILDRPQAPQLTGATLPGVPFVPTGVLGERAWASLLESTSRIHRTPLDSSSLAAHYERLTPTDGDEKLVHVQRHDGAVLLDRDTASVPLPDSTTVPRGRTDSLRTPASPTAWVLLWPGLSAATDVPAWLRRARLHSSQSDTARFKLFAPDGLQISREGTWEVLGSPRVVVRDSLRQRVVIGQSAWARHQARTLRAYHRDAASLDVNRWSVSDSSTWAADLLPHLQPALSRLAETHPQFQDVVSYLQNWDHVYDPSSIGATLFDQWMRTYRRDLGHVPTRADSAAFLATYRAHRALLRALNRLQSQFGSDVRLWRWERAISNRRFFPVWSADSLVSARLRDLHTTQYAPLDRSGRGHPSALAGGPSLVDPSPTAPSPTTWTAWTAGPNRSLVVRRHHYDPTELFARSWMERRRPSPLRLSADDASFTTTLLPARN